MTRFICSSASLSCALRCSVATGLAVGLLLASSGCNTDTAPPAQSRRSVDKKTVAFLVQSQRALKQGAFQAAQVMADSAIARAPRLPDAHFQQGRVLSELKQFEEAERAYRKVLELDPDYRGAWYNMGNNAYRQQAYDDAIHFYQRGLAQHSSAQTLVALGWAYVAQNNIDSARHAYKRAIAQDSSFALAYARLGQLYEDQGDLEQALKHSHKALALQPKNGKYQYVVGSQLLRLGQPKEASQHLRRATEILPWHQGAHFSFGQALLRLGQEEKAQQYLARADSLEQQQSEIERLRTIARNNPDNPEVWKSLGDKLRGAGQLDKAERVYSMALYLTPGDPHLRSTLAMVSAELGNTEAAVGHYRALLNQYPSFVEGWFNLGVVYARSGRDQQARKAWEEVLRQQPDHERAKAYLARLSADGS